MQAGISESTVLALECLRTTPANDPLLETDTPVSVQKPSHPLVSCPSPSQPTTTASAAQSPAKEAQPTAMMETSSDADSHIAEVAISQQPSTRTTAAAPAVSTQDTPQLAKCVLEQRQHATARVDQPQPMTARVDRPQPATKTADTKQGQQLTAIEPQTAASQMRSLSLAATLEADQPLLATAEGSQPPQAAASKMDVPPAATTSEVDEPQLATAVGAQPQPTVVQFLDMLFPPEQPRALSMKSRSSSLAGSSAVSEPPVPNRYIGKAGATDEKCCISEVVCDTGKCVVTQVQMLLVLLIPP